MTFSGVCWRTPTAYDNHRFWHFRHIPPYPAAIFVINCHKISSLLYDHIHRHHFRKSCRMIVVSPSWDHWPSESSSNFMTKLLKSFERLSRAFRRGRWRRSRRNCAGISIRRQQPSESMNENRQKKNQIANQQPRPEITDWAKRQLGGALPA